MYAALGCEGEGPQTRFKAVHAAMNSSSAAKAETCLAGLSCIPFRTMQGLPEA